MDFRTKTDITPLNTRLCHSDKLVVMGSCFAEHIGKKLERMKFRTVVNPFGVLYNPLSIAEGLKRLAEKRLFIEDELHEFPDGGWNTWLHHSQYSNPEKGAALAAINQSMEEASRGVAEAEVLIITLGTSWVYRLADTGEVVGNCHKVPERSFKRERLQVSEVVEALGGALGLISAINSKVRVLFTVSPVRHIKDGLHGNQLSKSTLLLAVDELCRRFPERCHYFPAYEIVMDELRDYRFYAEDMAHPSKQAVDYVWECFTAHCLDAEAQQFMQQWEKTARALEHRPFNPESEQYRQFVRHNMAQIQELKERYPHLDVDAELERCRMMMGV